MFINITITDALLQRCVVMRADHFLPLWADFDQLVLEIHRRFTVRLEASFTVRAKANQTGLEGVLVSPSAVTRNLKAKKIWLLAIAVIK